MPLPEVIRPQIADENLTGSVQDRCADEASPIWIQGVLQCSDLESVGCKNGGSTADMKQSNGGSWWWSDAHPPRHPCPISPFRPGAAVAGGGTLNEG